MKSQADWLPGTVTFTAAIAVTVLVAGSNPATLSLLGCSRRLHTDAAAHMLYKFGL